MVEDPHPVDVSVIFPSLNRLLFLALYLHIKLFFLALFLPMSVFFRVLAAEPFSTLSSISLHSNGVEQKTTSSTLKNSTRTIDGDAITILRCETLSGGPDLPISDVRWKPPLSGCYKLDVDAASLIEGGKWGIGAVVRDADGVVVAASCWQVLSLPNSEVAEALAMLKGLEFAKDMFFLDLIAESDASNVVLAQNAHQQSFLYVGSIIGDCINFKACFHSLNFLHITREANQAAHYLAKYALYNPDCMWIEETPPCISAVLVFDLLPDFR